MRLLTQGMQSIFATSENPVNHAFVKALGMHTTFCDTMEKIPTTKQCSTRVCSWCLFSALFHSRH